MIRWVRFQLGLGVLMLALLAVGASAAPADANFVYWYYPNPWSASSSGGGCWQTGVPPSTSSYACSTVGPGYLPSQTVRGGGNPTFPPWANPSGDYCTYYGLPDFNYAYPYDSSSWTGFQTPSPYSSYNWAGANGLCSAAGNRWGGYMSANGTQSSGSQNSCWATCGIQHSVSFGSRGTSLRPWASGFGSSPELILEANFNPHYWTTAGSNAGGWGYLCARFQDTTQPSGSPNLIEYCLEEWQPETNNSQWPQVDQLHYETYPVPFYMVITTFQPGTYYATQQSGSASTTEGGAPGNLFYSAAIQAGQIYAAAYWIDNSLHPGAGLSLNPADYALVGIEDGAEGWRQLTGYGYSTSTIQAYTQWTPGSSTAAPQTLRQPPTLDSPALRRRARSWGGPLPR